MLRFHRRFGLLVPLSQFATVPGLTSSTSAVLLTDPRMSLPDAPVSFALNFSIICVIRPPSHKFKKISTEI
jgi:hypothetical protein